MRRILPYLLAAMAFVVALFVVSTVGLDSIAPDHAEYTCRLPATHSEPYRVLVVGESWAAGDRLLPDLPEAIAARLHGQSVQVCTMAFSGKNSARVYLGIERETHNGGLHGLFQGARPDVVILLNGVNDQIQHVGARRYVKDTEDIAALFRGANFQVVSAPAIHPLLDWFAPYTRLRSEAKRMLMDRGHRDVGAEYRTALAAAHPGLHVIPYEDFLPRFEAGKFRTDGVHLTVDEFHHYGTFLGSRVRLR